MNHHSVDNSSADAADTMDDAAGPTMASGGKRRTKSTAVRRGLVVVVAVLSIVLFLVVIWSVSVFRQPAPEERFLVNVSGLGYKGVPWDASVKKMLEMFPDARDAGAPSDYVYVLDSRTTLRRRQFYFRPEGLCIVDEEWSSGGHRSGLRRMAELERAGLTAPAIGGLEEKKMWRLPDSLVVTFRPALDWMPDHFEYRVKSFP